MQSLIANGKKSNMIFLVALMLVCFVTWILNFI